MMQIMAKMTRNITSVLIEEGFIQDFEEIGEGINTQLLLSLKFMYANLLLSYIHKKVSPISALLWSIKKGKGTLLY